MVRFFNQIAWKKIISSMVSVVFISTNAAFAGIQSNLRPNAASSRSVAEQLEGDLSARKDGGTILSYLDVSKGQDAINYLINRRDTQYMKAVRSIDSANLVAVMPDGSFAYGHDVYDQLKKNKMSAIAVNIVSYSEIEGHLLAAMENNSIIIFEVARSQIGYAIDEKQVVEYTREIMKKIGCNIPVVVHGDHIQYTLESFDQNALLKEVYEKEYGKDSFTASMDVNKIDTNILLAVSSKLRENAAKERKDISDIIERLIKAGFTSVAIDASTLFDEKAHDYVVRYYQTKGTAEEKLAINLEEAFALPLEWGTDFLKGTADYNTIKGEVVKALKDRNRSDEEVAAKVKEMEAAYGTLVKEAEKAGLAADAVIAAYDRISYEVQAANIAGKLSDKVMETVSSKEKMLLLPTNNVEETAFQLAKIDELAKKYNPAMLGHVGKEVEVGHVDKKVPNPRRGGKLEAKMTHPMAIRVMKEVLDSKGLSFDIVAFNNGSGHGTDYDKDSLTPVSQVGKISPYLTADFKREVGDDAADAQHGTSGSDMEELAELSKAGVVKFNIATNNQQTQLNVHYLLHKGIVGQALMDAVAATPEKLVEGLSEETRQAMKQFAEDLKSGRMTDKIETADSTFTRFMKLTYAWAKKKGKVKDSSSVADIGLVFAKEFKRAFKGMDGVLVDMGRPVNVKRIGVLIGGGLASGHNSVLEAMVKEARKLGIEIVFIPEGWAGLVKGKKPLVLTEAAIKAAANKGGSIISTSRTNPYNKDGVAEGQPALVWKNIKALGLDGLVTLGGDDTNSVSYNLQKDHPDFFVIGLPKTMDNDIALPEQDAQTYGYDSFVEGAIKAMESVVIEAHDLKRIMVTEVFGRNAGFVADSVAANIGATRSLIPEEELDLEQLVNDMGAYYGVNEYGVVLVAEGVKISRNYKNNAKYLDAAFAADPMAKLAFETAEKAMPDAFGHPKLENSGKIIAAVLTAGLKMNKVKAKVNETGKLDYQIRSVPVSKKDKQMTQMLGTAVVKRIAARQSNQLLYVYKNEIKSMELTNKLGGRTLDFQGQGLDKEMHALANMATIKNAHLDLGTQAQNEPVFDGLIAKFNHLKQGEQLDITYPEMKALLGTLNSLTGAVGEDVDTFNAIRRMVNRIHPRYGDQLKRIASVVDSGDTDIALRLAEVMKPINFYGGAFNALIARSGSLANFEGPRYEPGLNLVAVRGLKGSKQMDAEQFVELNTHYNGVFTPYQVRGMRLGEPIVVDKDTKVETIIVPADANTGRPETTVLYFDYNMPVQKCFEIIQMMGITLDNVVADYGPTDDKQGDRLQAYIDMGFSVIGASPMNKASVIAMLKARGFSEENFAEGLYAFNRGDISALIKILDTLSCTTNAMVPTILLMEEFFGIKSATGLTTHAATDSNLFFPMVSKRARKVLDKLRGFPIGDNIQPASTGASDNVVKMNKDLAGKVIIECDRVGTLAGSKFNITFHLNRATTGEEVKGLLKKFATEMSDGAMKFYEGEDSLSWSPLETSRIVGWPESSIIDGFRISVLEGDPTCVVIHGLYDNQAAAPGQMMHRWVPYMASAQRLHKILTAESMKKIAGIEAKAFEKMGIYYSDLAEAVKASGTKGAIVVNAEAIFNNVLAIPSLKTMKDTGALEIIVQTSDANAVERLTAMGVGSFASIQMKKVAGVVLDLNGKGIVNDRIAFINGNPKLDVKEELKETPGVKAITIGTANGNAINAMPLAVAKAATMVAQNEAVTTQFKAVANVYRNVVSEEAYQTIEDVTAAVSEMPLITVESELGQAQAAYEESVSRI